MDKQRSKHNRSLIAVLLIMLMVFSAGCSHQPAKPTENPAETTTAPEPVEMVGVWELAWTEIEGDRNEAKPGECTIEILSSASAGLMMSYTSRDFPDKNFEYELLIMDEREMYFGCGNHAWVADLDYVGPWDTTYTVTLSAEDILIKQNYFLVDGAPTVSYEYFCRLAE